MNNQEILIKAIRNLLSDKHSIIQEISDILNCSYDAAHRRVSLKSKFSIEETVQLCDHYSISMDGIFGFQNRVVIEKTVAIKGFDDLKTYFEQSSNYLMKYKGSNEAKLFYPAKDIPVFYTTGSSLLSKFKIYIWLNLLNGTQQMKSFDDFQMPLSLTEYSVELKSIYDSIHVNEIWNDTTINSTLQQVYYFFESGLLSYTSLVVLLEDVKCIIKDLESKCTQDDTEFNLYYNELLTLNNNVVITDQDDSTLFVPYTVLGYFITEDQSTCQDAEEYFLNQVKNSKNLNTSGVRDRNIFFNKMYQKIEYYIQKADNQIEI